MSSREKFQAVIDLAQSIRGMDWLIIGQIVKLIFDILKLLGSDDE